MADEIKVGAALVEIKASVDKLKEGLNRAKGEAQRGASEIEKNMSKIRIDFDTRLMKLKLNDVQKLHSRLKKRLEEKIKLNYDLGSINRTKTQLKSVEDALEGIKRKSNEVTSKTGGSLFGGTGGFIAKAGITAFALKQLANIGLAAAKSQGEIEGVEEAFKNLNKPNLLSSLRKATRETISDFELMKLSVRASNFQVPLSQLGTLLDFARKRAMQTGESVDYMANSIIDGIGRKSTLVLDNLGISATELQEEVKKVGDFGQATGNIVSRELAKMGNVSSNAAEKVSKLGAKLDNIGSKLGNLLSPAFSQSLDMLNEFIDGIDTLVLKMQGFGKTDLIPQLDYKKGEFTDEELNRLKDGISFIPGEGYVKFKKNSKEFIKTAQTLKDELKLLQIELENSVDITDSKTRDKLLNQISTKEKLINDFLNPNEKKESPKDKDSNYNISDMDAFYSGINLFNYEESYQSLEEVAAEMFRVQEEYDQQFLNNEISRTDFQLSNIRRIDEERRQQEQEIHNLRMASISEFGYALESLGSHNKTFISYLNTALQTAIRIKEAFDSMGKDQLSGTLGIVSSIIGLVTRFVPGLAKGGTVTNQGGNISIEPYQKFATGANNFVVPPGFNRDNYLIGVQSGEKVSVTPAGASGNSLSPLLKEVNRLNNGLASRDMNLIGALNDLINVSVNKQLTTALKGNDIRVSYEKSKKQNNRLS